MKKGCFITFPLYFTFAKVVFALYQHNPPTWQVCHLQMPIKQQDYCTDVSWTGHSKMHGFILKKRYLLQLLMASFGKVMTCPTLTLIGCKCVTYSPDRHWKCSEMRDDMLLTSKTDYFHCILAKNSVCRTEKIGRLKRGCSSNLLIWASK